MAQQNTQNNQALANLIKARRIDLGLTIEDAAFTANISTKSWSRYESGLPIRTDKIKGVCKALNWIRLPDDFDPREKTGLDEYQEHECWSTSLCDAFGTTAAVSFVIGSDILFDHIEEDIRDLSAMPKQAHLGQLGTSFIRDILPPQFIPHYDYDFLFLMRSTLIKMRTLVKQNQPIIAHSILDELILYLIAEEAIDLISTYDELDQDVATEWVFDLFDDMDIITFLYSDWYLTTDDSFHFNKWNKQQFYCSED